MHRSVPQRLAPAAVSDAIVILVSACGSGTGSGGAAADDQVSPPTPVATPVAAEVGASEIRANEIRQGRTGYIRRPVDRADDPFTLTDQDGGEVGLDDFRGQWVEMNRVDSNCMTVCRAMTGELMRVRESPGDRYGSLVHFLSGTFDADQDDAEALRTHSDALSANHSGWSWLTGNKEEADAVASA